MSSFVSILLAILLLGILIAIHEAGHFWAARLTGIEVKEFAIGFGPKLVSWTGKKRGTRFSLRAIPLGGFCAFYGEDDIDGTSKQDPRAFNNQKVWKRMITVLMGPIMNFVLAFVVMIGFYLCVPYESFIGEPRYVPTVTKIVEGMPAQEAGIQVGDEIRMVNGIDVTFGTEVTDLTASPMHQAINVWQEGDGPLAVTVSRNGTVETVYMKPAVNGDGYRIGIEWHASAIRVDEAGNSLVCERTDTFAEACQDSLNVCLRAGSAIYDALGKLVTRGEGLQDTGGPVAVVQVVSQQVQENGMEEFFWLLCLISINLGIMNLLPIPGLDGGRFLFMVIEAICRRPVPRKAEAIINVAFTLLLFALMIFLTFRDVWRLFQ